MCPTCRVDMLAVELDGIEIDHCLDCLGSWLDHGEIEMIAQRVGADSRGLTQLLDDAAKKGGTDRRCPRCNRLMVEVLVAVGRVATSLDRCPRGHGFWFDRGEIGQLVSLLHGVEGEALADFLGEVLKNELQADSK